MATSATILLNRFSYPKQPGDQPWSMIDVAGPAAYVEFAPSASPGTPPTGGQEIRAQDFGLQSLEFVMAMGSSDGVHSGVIVPLGGSLATHRELTPGDDFLAVALVWMEIATGQQAAAGDLSTSTMRLLGIGR